MKKLRRRNCLCCRLLFFPDPRQKKRQRYCSASACRKASKTASQQKWLSKAQNKDYFSSTEHVQRVQAWRALHPGYWRSKKPTLSDAPLQETLLSQVIDNSKETDELTRRPLQDLITLQVPVLIGIIAHLTGETLQDQIAHSVDRLLTLGADILNNHQPSSQGEAHENQPHQPATPASNSPTL